MAMKVKSSEFKLATKLASQVRDTANGSAKKFPWMGLYRFVASDGQVVLYANDGFTWLTWYLPLEEPTVDVYDVVFSAPRLNETVSKLYDGLYEISYEDNQYVLRHLPQQLCVPEEAALEYKQAGTSTTSEFEDQVFAVEAAVLAKNFKFAVPFVDANNANAMRSVATWTTDGMMLAGWHRQQVKIEGMPCPPLPLSFKQKLLKSVVAFLSELKGEVYITVSGGNYIFDCPTSHHQLVVGKESAHHPGSAVGLDENKLDTIIRFDGKKLLSGVSQLNTTLPAEADRLAVTVEGTGDDGAMWVAVLGEETTKKEKSKDRFPLIREGSDDTSLNFVVNCRVFESCLGQMNGVILEGRFYFKGTHPWLCIEDERSTDTDTYRCVFIPVTLAKNGDEVDEAADDEVVVHRPEPKKPEKKSLLTKK